MKYKIVNYKKEKFYIENKKELFNLLDSGKYHRLTDYFTDEDFKFSSSGNFVIDSEIVSVLDPYSFRVRYLEETNIKKVNSLYMIFNEKNVKVNLEELIKEYNQSRKKENYYGTQYYFNRSTQKYRNRSKSYFKTYKNSFTKEYRDNLYAKEEGIKIRSSREKEIKEKHVFLYEDDLDYRNPKKSWKSYKRNKKQWLKNKSKH
jgi:hypothetical protein